MKLKSIMYTLGYGKSRKQLVRSEGARRVKQAEKMSYKRGIALRDKALRSLFRYGVKTDQLISHLEQSSVQKGDKIGIQLLESGFSECFMGRWSSIR